MHHDVLYRSSCLTVPVARSKSLGVGGSIITLFGDREAFGDGGGGGRCDSVGEVGAMSATGVTGVTGTTGTTDATGASSNTAYAQLRLKRSVGSIELKKNLKSQTKK